MSNVSTFAPDLSRLADVGEFCPRCGAEESETNCCDIRERSINKVRKDFENEPSYLIHYGMDHFVSVVDPGFGYLPVIVEGTEGAIDADGSYNVTMSYRVAW